MYIPFCYKYYTIWKEIFYVLFFIQNKQTGGVYFACRIICYASFKPVPHLICGFRISRYDVDPNPAEHRHAWVRLHMSDHHTLRRFSCRHCCTKKIKWIPNFHSLYHVRFSVSRTCHTILCQNTVTENLRHVNQWLLDFDIPRHKAPHTVAITCRGNFYTE